MQHQRHAERFPLAAGEFGPMRGGGWRQAVAGDVREVHAAALEEVAFFDDAGGAPAPGVAPERLAVEAFEGSDDALLQAGEVVVDEGGIHGV